jgi:hypothetical protein
MEIPDVKEIMKLDWIVNELVNKINKNDYMTLANFSDLGVSADAAGLLMSKNSKDTGFHMQRSELYFVLLAPVIQKVSDNQYSIEACPFGIINRSYLETYTGGLGIHLPDFALRMVKAERGRKTEMSIGGVGLVAVDARPEDQRALKETFSGDRVIFPVYRKQ